MFELDCHILDLGSNLDHQNRNGDEAVDDVLGQ